MSHQVTQYLIRWLDRAKTDFFKILTLLWQLLRRSNELRLSGSRLAERSTCKSKEISNHDCLPPSANFMFVPLTSLPLSCSRDLLRGDAQLTTFDREV